MKTTPDTAFTSAAMALRNIAMIDVLCGDAKIAALIMARRHLTDALKALKVSE